MDGGQKNLEDEGRAQKQRASTHRYGIIWVILGRSKRAGLQQGFLDLEKFGYSYCLAIFSCKETGVVGSIRKSQASDAFMVQETLKVDDNL